MAELLVDTDVCIAHLSGKARLPKHRGRLAYSTVTRAELFTGPEHQTVMARRVLAPMRELPVDRRVAERAGTIRREIGIKLPDALIAATARWFMVWRCQALRLPAAKVASRTASVGSKPWSASQPTSTARRTAR